MRRILAAIAVTTMAVAGLSACGSDAKSSKDVASSIADAIKKGETPGSSGSGNSELDKLLAKQKEANVYITYKQGDDTFSIAQDGKGNSAMIRDDSITIATKDNKLITCGDTDGSDPSCTETPGSEGTSTMITGAFGAFGAILAGLQSSGLTGVKTTSSEIAGRDATCSTISPSDFVKGIAGAAGNDEGLNNKLTICLDKATGFYLKLANTENPDDDTVATAFRESKPSDFEPPATPKSISDLTNEMTSTTDAGSDSGN